MLNLFYKNIRINLKIPKQSGVPEVLHLARVCPHLQNKPTKKPQSTEASSKTKSWILHIEKTGYASVGFHISSREGLSATNKF